MKIAEVMTRDVRTIGPDRSVRDAARIMDEMNVGVLPVCDGRRLLGMITDRDIAVRSTATGVAPDRHRVREIMSTSLQWCFEDDDAEDVLRHMSERQIRRMPVVDGERRLVGIVALGDLAADNAPGTKEALRRISSPAEPDRSGTPTAARADETRRTGRDPLTSEEHRELERPAREAERGGGDRFGGGSRAEGAPDVGPPRGDLQGFPSDYTGYSSRGLRDEDLRRAAHGSGEGWRRDGDRGFRFRDEDDRRAAFPGGFNEGYGEGGGRGGRMPGGFGGDGYNSYGGPAPAASRDAARRAAAGRATTTSRATARGPATSRAASARRARRTTTAASAAAARTMRPGAATASRTRPRATAAKAASIAGAGRRAIPAPTRASMRTSASTSPTTRTSTRRRSRCGSRTAR